MFINTRGAQPSGSELRPWAEEISINFPLLEKSGFRLLTLPEKRGKQNNPY
jgi:hypothetical protein